MVAYMYNVYSHLSTFHTEQESGSYKCAGLCEQIYSSSVQCLSYLIPESFVCKMLRLGHVSVPLMSVDHRWEDNSAPCMQYSEKWLPPFIRSTQYDSPVCAELYIIHSIPSNMSVAFTDMGVTTCTWLMQSICYRLSADCIFNLTLSQSQQTLKPQLDRTCTVTNASINNELYNTSSHRISTNL